MKLLPCPCAEPEAGSVKYWLEPVYEELHQQLVQHKILPYEIKAFRQQTNIVR